MAATRTLSLGWLIIAGFIVALFAFVAWLLRNLPTKPPRPRAAVREDDTDDVEAEPPLRKAA